MVNVLEESAAGCSSLRVTMICAGFCLIRVISVELALPESVESFRGIKSRESALGIVETSLLASSCSRSSLAASLLSARRLPRGEGKNGSLRGDGGVRRLARNEGAETNCAGDPDADRGVRTEERFCGGGDEGGEVELGEGDVRISVSWPGSDLEFSSDGMDKKVTEPC